MDADYLKTNVGEALAITLAQTVHKGPPDPVSFLAHALLNLAAERKQKEISSKLQEQLRVEDEKLLQEEKEYEQTILKRVQSNTQGNSTQDTAFRQLLSSATHTDVLPEQIVQQFTTLYDAATVYIAELIRPGVLNIVASNDNTLVERKITKSSKGLVWSLLGGSGGNVGSDGEDEDEIDTRTMEEDEEEEGEARTKDTKRDELKSIFIQNVLMDSKSDRIMFLKTLQKPGSLLMIRLTYRTLLTDDIMDKALLKEQDLIAARIAEANKSSGEEEETATEEEEEESEEEEVPKKKSKSKSSKEREREREREREKESKKGRKGREEKEERKAIEKKASKQVEQPSLDDLNAPPGETPEARVIRLKEEAEKHESLLLSKLPVINRELILYVDKIGAGKFGDQTRLTEKQVESIKSYAREIVSTMETLDHKLFREERQKRSTLVNYNTHIREKSEDEKEEEMEKISEMLEAAHKPMTNEDIRYVWRTQQLLGLKSVLMELKSHQVFRGPLSVLQAFFYTLDYPKQEIVNNEEQPEWKTLRNKLTDDLFNRIKEYDPRALSLKPVAETKHTTIKNLVKLLKGIDYEEIRERNYPLAIIYSWVVDTLSVKRKAKAERKAALEQARQEEQARLEAEAEAERKRKDEEDGVNDTENTGTEDEDESATNDETDDTEEE